jgi:hypothetical protein
MSERLPLHYFTEPIHADMRYEEPDALSIHWLARYAIKSRDNPELLEKITEELAQVLSERLFDDALFDLWVSHAPGCAFEKGGYRFLGMVLAAFETIKLSMNVPMRRTKNLIERIELAFMFRDAAAPLLTIRIFVHASAMDCFVGLKSSSQ